MQFKFVTSVLTAAVLSSLLLMASHPAPAITGLADEVLPDNHYR